MSDEVLKWKRSAYALYESSFGTTNASKYKVKFDCEVGINDDGTGYFELSDTHTGGLTYYATGCLIFEGKKLIDYDGVFSLPNLITDKLAEIGYDVSYATD